VFERSIPLRRIPHKSNLREGVSLVPLLCIHLLTAIQIGDSDGWMKVTVECSLPTEESKELLRRLKLVLDRDRAPIFTCVCIVSVLFDFPLREIRVRDDESADKQRY